MTVWGHVDAERHGESFGFSDKQYGTNILLCTGKVILTFLVPSEATLQRIESNQSNTSKSHHSIPVSPMPSKRATEPATTDSIDIEAAYLDALHVCAMATSDRHYDNSYQQLANHLHHWLQANGHPDNCTRDDLDGKRRDNGLTFGGIHYRRAVAQSLRRYQVALDGGPRNQGRSTLPKKELRSLLNPDSDDSEGERSTRRRPAYASSARRFSSRQRKRASTLTAQLETWHTDFTSISPRHREPSHESFDPDDEMHGDFLREERGRRRYESRSSHGTPEYYTKAEGKRPRR